MTLPDGISTDDWAGVRAARDADRRAVLAVDDAYQARNPNQALTVSFDARGATATPDLGDWTWGLELASWGLVGAPQVVAEAAQISHKGEQLNYAWGPELTEWWINDTRGFEHGFTVHGRPEAAEGCADARLQFTIDVRGDLHAVVSPDRHAVEFLDGAGVARLSYAGLVALDAGGDLLDAWLEVSDGELHLFVREGGARYPITIDPLVQQVAYVKASNPGVLDLFGSAVAISGDTMVVGARGEDSNATGVGGNQASNSSNGAGAAYVFVRSGGVWAQEAYLKASNTDPHDAFGGAVAISGDTLVVAAAFEDSNATGIDGIQANNDAGNAGAVYVFVRSGGTWAQEAYVKASNAEVLDLFGVQVDLSGDTLIVGAWGEDSDATGIGGNQASNSALNAGAAYVFVRSGGAWTQEAYLKASNGGAGDAFGNTVAFSGETAVVTADLEGSNATGVNGNQADDSAPEAGAAYVFVRSGGAWTQQAYLKASNTEAGDRFGSASAISGDTLVLGARLESSGAAGVNGNQGDNSASRAGAAYVFVRGAGAWTQEAYLKASNPDPSDLFGSKLALEGDTLVAGVRWEDSVATGIGGSQANGSVNSGAAYVFVRSGGTWAQDAYVKASNSETYDLFGASVAVSGNAMFVGANWESSDATGINGDQANNLTARAGAIYVFDLGGSGSVGTNYGVSVPNSTGTGGVISAVGSAVVADNDVTLTGSSLPPSSFGYFLTSQTQAFIANPAGSAGNLLVGGSIGRYVGPGQIQNTGAAGEFSLALDLTAMPTPTGPVPVQAGETWNFTTWHRDAVGGVATSNFTNGLAVQFQ